MHGHPASIGINLTDAHVKMTFPDGTTEDITMNAGEVVSYPAGEHLPENVSDEPLELVLVELKGKE
jgi:uncharacterized RmlC-like cupin family protein